MILVDSAVGSHELIPDLEKAGLAPQKANIAGDLAWVGRGEQGREVSIGVEFKRLPELVDSLRSGRLVGEQLPKMRASYEYSWLLIEGELLTTYDGYLARRIGPKQFVPLHGKMSIYEFYERLWILYLKGGLFPWATRNRTQSIQAIAALYRLWTSKNLDEHRSHLSVYNAPAIKGATQFRQTVVTLPTVGWVASGHAESYFDNSLRRAFAATVTDWQQVPGIGKKSAEKIVGAIEG